MTTGPDWTTIIAGFATAVVGILLTLILKSLGDMRSSLDKQGERFEKKCEIIFSSLEKKVDSEDCDKQVIRCANSCVSIQDKCTEKIKLIDDKMMCHAHEKRPDGEDRITFKRMIGV